MALSTNIRQFLKLESFSGILLCATALLGLILENSPARGFYNHLLHEKHLADIINEGLMTLFFFLVGLEIKREILTGELNSTAKIILPAFAAFLGMILPAMIYVGLNYTHPTLLRGWAIPTATDIAFALAILSLLGSRIPLSLKIFLTALAIFDDLGAIVVIAIFYANYINMIYLYLSLGLFLGLLLLNYYKVYNLILYLCLGVLLWFCVLHSGIHATIAGVLVALVIPAQQQQPLEQKIHPWVAYLILPLFAFSNMAIPFDNLSWHIILTSVPLGIALGLFLGKQLGIFLAVWITVKTGFARLPAHTNWKMIYGVSLLGGIGFTMSLFIGGLAFNDNQTVELVRTGVLAGSVLSGLLGYLMLRV